jgi:amidohydrolase
VTLTATERSREAADLKRDALAAVDEYAGTLIELSRRIHSAPELAFREHQACERLTGAVEEAGLEVERGAYGLETAFSASFGREGATVALVSEYDALPDVGHACGHNIIATIGLGATLALHRLADRLPGNVRYVGTPAEERGCGKELLARAGAWDRVDAAMMIHPASLDLKAIRAQCLADLTVSFTGHAAHPALTPDAARSALDALVLSYQALAMLREHLKGTERITGVITEGGSAPNVIPERAVSSYFVRAANLDDLEVLKGRVERCCRGAAEATGCELELSWGAADYLDMRVNLPLADAYEANAGTLGREMAPYEWVPPATSDMANVSHRVPVLHAVIGCAPLTAMLHTREFAAAAGSPEGEQAVLDGAKALAMTAIDFLTDAGLRRRAAEAFATTNDDQSPLTPREDE